MKTRYFLIFLLISFFFASCKGKHKKDDIVKPSDTTENVNKKIQRNAEDLAMAEKVFGESEVFNTLETQFKIQISGRGLNASGTMRMAKDSVIWLYIKALGLEVARAKFTKDSVYAVVKLKSQYFKGDYSLARKFLPIAADYDVIQSILINKMFLFPDNKAENLDYFSMSMSDSTTLQLNTLPNPDFIKNFSFNHSINIDTKINRMTSTTMDYPEKNITVSLLYSDYQNIDNHLMPFSIDIKLADNAYSMNINKVTFEKKLSFPISIPDGYKPFEIK